MANIQYYDVILKPPVIFLLEGVYGLYFLIPMRFTPFNYLQRILTCFVLFYYRLPNTYYDVILKPVITEKSMNAMADKEYTFLVHPEAILFYSITDYQIPLSLYCLLSALQLPSFS